MKSFIMRLIGVGSRKSTLEELILDSVSNCLDGKIATLWDLQVKAINKIQRLPEGSEVNFYRMKNGRPSFDDNLAFPNRSTEILVANVNIEMNGLGMLSAKLWCVKGFLFSIEYDGSASYFEEAVGMDPPPKFTINCELEANLADASSH